MHIAILNVFKSILGQLNPLGYWPLDANTFGTTDVEGRFETASTSLTAVPGPCGTSRRAYSFTMFQKSHVKVKANGRLAFKKDFTLALFVNPAKGNNPLIEYGNRGTGIKFWLYPELTLSVELAYRETGTGVKYKFINSSLELRKGKWSFVAVTYSIARRVLTFHKDATTEVVPYQGNVADFMTSGDIIFGARQSGEGVFPELGLTGAMSDVMIFARVVTADELRRIRSSCPRGKGPSPKYVEAIEVKFLSLLS
jgi:hypothetical protein